MKELNQKNNEPKISEEKVIDVPEEQEAPTDQEKTLMTIPQLKERLVNIPEEKREYATKLYAYNQQKDKLSMEKKNMELSTFTNVSKAKGPDGKPLYSNEKFREAETKKLLKENVAYRELVEKEDKTLYDTHMAKIELDYLKDSLKSIGILVELMKLE